MYPLRCFSNFSHFLTLSHVLANLCLATLPDTFCLQEARGTPVQNSCGMQSMWVVIPCSICSKQSPRTPPTRFISMSRLSCKGKFLEFVPLMQFRIHLIELKILSPNYLKKIAQLTDIPEDKSEAWRCSSRLIITPSYWFWWWFVRRSLTIRNHKGALHPLLQQLACLPTSHKKILFAWKALVLQSSIFVCQIAWALLSSKLYLVLERIKI